MTAAWTALQRDRSRSSCTLDSSGTLDSSDSLGCGSNHAGRQRWLTRRYTTSRRRRRTRREVFASKYPPLTAPLTRSRADRRRTRFDHGSIIGPKKARERSRAAVSTRGRERVPDLGLILDGKEGLPMDRTCGVAQSLRTSNPSGIAQRGRARCNQSLLHPCRVRSMARTAPSGCEQVQIETTAMRNAARQGVF
jgi:hypothetical protein